MKLLTVLIPAKNEEDAIGGVIDAVPFDGLKKLGLNTDVLVVDGNSVDKTREIARKKGARVLRQKGSGKGLGVQQAFEEFRKTKPDFVVMLDGDATYDAGQIPLVLLPLLTGEADVVVGKRHVSKKSMSFANRFGNRLLSLFSSYAVRSTPDLCTGYWAFGNKAIQRIRPSAKGFDIEADLLIESRHKRLRLKSLPVSYAARIGETKLNPLSSGFRIALRFVRRMRDWNPLALFCGIGLLLFLAAALIGWLLVAEFVVTGEVIRVPRLVISGFLILFGVLSIGFGLIMDYIEHHFEY